MLAPMGDGGQRQRQADRIGRHGALEAPAIKAHRAGAVVGGFEFGGGGDFGLHGGSHRVENGGGLPGDGSNLPFGIVDVNTHW